MLLVMSNDLRKQLHLNQA